MEVVGISQNNYLIYKKEKNECQIIKLGFILFYRTKNPCADLNRLLKKIIDSLKG